MKKIILISTFITSLAWSAYADTNKPTIEVVGGYFPSEILQNWNFDIMPVLESFNATSSNIFLVTNIRDHYTGDIKLSQTDDDVVLPANSQTSPTALMMHVADSSVLGPGTYDYDMTVYRDFLGNKHDAETLPLGTLTVFASMPTTAPQVDAVSPAQGEILKIGKKYPIAWTTNSDAANMPVSLLLIQYDQIGEPNIVETITSGLRNASVYSWRVEDTIKPGIYAIRIVVNPGGLTGMTIHTPQFKIESNK